MYRKRDDGKSWLQLWKQRLQENLRLDREDLVTKLRNLLITGLLVIFPIALTFWVLILLYNLTIGFIVDPLTDFLNLTFPLAPLLGILLSLLIVLFIGFLASNIIGRQILSYGDWILSRTPLVNSIYLTIKQVMDAFTHSEGDEFKRVCMIEYPRRDLYVVGFVTGRSRGEVQQRSDRRLVNVFVPTTPNPTSGYLVLVPQEDVTHLDMSVEEGMRLIISGGIVSPADPDTAAKSPNWGGPGVPDPDAPGLSEDSSSAAVSDESGDRQGEEER